MTVKAADAGRAAREPPDGPMEGRYALYASVHHPYSRVSDGIACAAGIFSAVRAVRT